MSSDARFFARHRWARLTSRKAGLVADLIRGKTVNQALEILEFAPQRAAAYYLKLLRSAVANASQDEAVDVNGLYVKDARADGGPLLNDRMRWRPGPQGRALPFRRRTAHLTIGLAEREAEAIGLAEREAGSARRRRKPAAKAAQEA
jgi:large subunit ribosomal protein L22